MSWEAALREIDQVLDAWEAFVADPAAEPMPVTDVPALPDQPLQPHLVEAARGLKARADLLQTRLARLQDETTRGLAEIRKHRAAASAYR